MQSMAVLMMATWEQMTFNLPMPGVFKHVVEKATPSADGSTSGNKTLSSRSNSRMRKPLNTNRLNGLRLKGLALSAFIVLTMAVPAQADSWWPVC